MDLHKTSDRNCLSNPSKMNNRPQGLACMKSLKCAMGEVSAFSDTTSIHVDIISTATIVRVHVPPYRS